MPYGCYLEIRCTRKCRGNFGRENIERTKTGETLLQGTCILQSLVRDLSQQRIIVLQGIK
jgi:hypothetical protein